MAPWRAAVRFFVFSAVLAIPFVFPAGARIHLCFDGREPPVSVQISQPASAGVTAHAFKPTADVDLALADEAPLKQFGDLAHPSAFQLRFGIDNRQFSISEFNSFAFLLRGACQHPPSRAPPT